MAAIRTGRQKYYTVFARFYDWFIQVHAGKHRDETRRFLVQASLGANGQQVRVLDICCGTGSVINAFAKQYPTALLVGYDFSTGMLRKAKEKTKENSVAFVQGDAACLSCRDSCFDIVCCSHALYELKGADRTAALQEMRRVVKPDGKVLIMEHEVPEKPIIKLLFHMRMLIMGSADSKEFLEGDLSPYKKIFRNIELLHTPSGKSKLLLCSK